MAAEYAALVLVHAALVTEINRGRGFSIGSPLLLADKRARVSIALTVFRRAASLVS
jgi:hypothetical protein